MSLSSMMRDMMISEIFKMIKSDRFNQQFTVDEKYFNEVFKIKITLELIVFEGFLAQKLAHHLDCMGCFFKSRNEDDSSIILLNPRDVLREIDLDILLFLYQKMENQDSVI